jgi:hypothetical protein
LFIGLVLLRRVSLAQLGAAAQEMAKFIEAADPAQFVTVAQRRVY